MLRRRVAILTLGWTIPVLLRLHKPTPSLMTSKPTARDLRLKASILGSLPLADITEVDVLRLHRNQRDPAQLEPRACLCLDHLGVLTARTDARTAIALLLDLGRAAEDDG